MLPGLSHTWESAGRLLVTQAQALGGWCSDCGHIPGLCAGSMTVPLTSCQRGQRRQALASQVLQEGSLTNRNHPSEPWVRLVWPGIHSAGLCKDPPGADTR